MKHVICCDSVRIAIEDESDKTALRKRANFFICKGGDTSVVNLHERKTGESLGYL